MKSPKGWNKTVEGLFEEMRQGKRLLMTHEEGNWALEYERSLLPAGTVFPREGQVWETVDECNVNFEAFFTAPGGGPSGAVGFPRGEKVRIGPHTSSEGLSVHFLPLRYEEFQAIIVAAHVRANPRYEDYALYAKTGFFNEHFRLVNDVA